MPPPGSPQDSESAHDGSQPDAGPAVFPAKKGSGKEPRRETPFGRTLERLALAERRADEQDARFAAFMEHLPNIAFLKDGQGRTVFGNRFYEEIFGVRLADVLGKRDDEWLPPAVARETMAADAEVLATGRTMHIEEEIPTALGPRHWLTSKFRIPASSGGWLLGGIAVDITKQKETERKLEELLALQNALVNSANVAIISTGPSGLVRTFNAAAERLLGYHAGELIDRAPPETWHQPEELQRIAHEIFEKTGEIVPPNTEAVRWGSRDGKVAEHELTLVRKDGSTFPASLAITALWSEGRIIGYMGVIQDITARREFEEAQRHAREEAEESNRAKSQFVANMSHEVRTPLNGILGIAAMLLETDLQPRQRELAEHIQSSGQALLAIVNDILDISKVEAGRVELEAIGFDLRALLQSVHDMHQARAEEKNLIIETEVAGDVPAGLHGDPGRLRQVFDNLVGNAIKFSENCRVRISAAVDALDGTDLTLRFHVIDCGIGIPREQQERIFEPFVQADVSTTRLFGGTGLGLSICRQLVSLMGGEIGVVSELGRGADFWFTARFVAAGTPTEKAEAAASPKVESLRGLRTLLAEDNALNRLVATHQLRKLGCDVETVENGRQAVDLTKTIQFDLILMDCQMPVLDGYAATAAIRDRERREGGHTPIIALTASALATERDRCLAAGMDGYLSKPFTEAELHRQIHGVMLAAASPDREESSGPALDSGIIAALRDECGPDGGALFARYVNFFREDLAQAEKEFAEPDGAKKTETLRQAAHHLRGAALHFGARPLMDLCARVERSAGAGGSLDEVTAHLPALRQEITRVKEALEAGYG